ncbi:MAG: low temperature requirement protein A [Verrucomicrobiales bacterium]|nr:low temperature requirement protein A [Verrucomicrobiales bacterium]
MSTPVPSRHLWHRKMVSRDPTEPHRAATPLELLYDLIFVVAIAQAASSLHHALAHGEGWHALQPFLQVFFGIWWAWMGFTWFASAYDTDDVPYRLKVLLQMFGLLLLAAGVPKAFQQQNWTYAIIGYSIMRLGLVAQWLRAARSDPVNARTAARYAAGIMVCQLIWISMLFMPPAWVPWVWWFAIPLELLMPVWAESSGNSQWHPHHISERYGLMTIIVIGESVLAATLAIQAALDATHLSPSLIAVCISAPIILFAMWWLYFLEPFVSDERTSWRAFAWGYGHFFVFASAAATGTGLAVSVDHAAHTTHLPQLSAHLALSIPVAAYLCSLMINHLRCVRGLRWGYLLAGACCIAASWLPLTPVWIAVILSILTAREVALDHRSSLHVS